MDFFIYRDKILQGLKTRDEGLKNVMLEGLKANRSQLLGEVKAIMPGVDGRLRLALLEVLMEDGQKDLLPLFLYTISIEANVLFAKSMILLYGHFTHFEAMEALRELQGKLRSQLTATCQRVIGKLNAKFREQFYMTEFLAGKQNAKRMKNAGQAMIKAPHPLYIPFLNERLADDPVYRSLAVEVLAQVGDATSIESLFGLFRKVRDEKNKALPLVLFLLDEKHRKCSRLADYLSELGAVAGWEETLPPMLAAEVLDKKLSTTLDWIIYSFGPFPGFFWSTVSLILKKILLKGEIDKEEIIKLNGACESFLKSTVGLARDISGAVGAIGHRCAVVDLYERLESSIPLSDLSRDRCLAAFLGQYRTGRSGEILAAMVQPDKDPGLLRDILDALAHYQIHDTPPAIFELAKNPERPGLRHRAMLLMAKWRPEEKALQQLLTHENASVRNEAALLIAEHGLEPGYPLLLACLHPETSRDFLIVVLEALAAFPRTRTGEAVLPWFHPSRSYPVLQAALATLSTSGGPGGFGLIVQGLKVWPEDKLTEILTSVFTLMEPRSGEEQPDDLLGHPNFWEGLLLSSNGKFRMFSLNMLEKANWARATRLDQWLASFKRVLQTDQVRWTEKEKRRLRGLFLKARARQTMGNTLTKDQTTQKRNLLTQLLENLENSSHHDRLAALRKVNLRYQPDLLSDQNRERLAYQILNFCEESEGDPVGLKLAISVAGKMAHDLLNETLEQYLNHEDREVARFARTALHLSNINEGVNRRIQSIFIMDHTRLMAKTLKRFLEKTGYEVSVAHQLEDGMNALKGAEFDLLLLEFQLGGVSGLDFLKSARREHVAPGKVLFMTTSRDEGDQHAMKVAGDGVLVKPFSMELLHNMIKSLEG